MRHQHCYLMTRSNNQDSFAIYIFETHIGIAMGRSFLIKGQCRKLVINQPLLLAELIDTKIPLGAVD